MCVLERLRFKNSWTNSNLHCFRRNLHVHVQEDTLSDQLLDLDLPRLQQLTLTGGNLHALESPALSSLQNCRRLVVEITGTQVQDIPPGFFSSLARVSHLSINLRDNNLMSLSPAAFYSNATSWENVGTKLIAGNGFECRINYTLTPEWIEKFAICLFYCPRYLKRSISFNFSVILPKLTEPLGLQVGFFCKTTHGRVNVVWCGWVTGCDDGSEKLYRSTQFL